MASLCSEVSAQKSNAKQLFHLKASVGTWVLRPPLLISACHPQIGNAWDDAVEPFFALSGVYDVIVSLTELEGDNGCVELSCVVSMAGNCAKTRAEQKSR